MVKLDKIYTRGGDKGLTSLGDGSRVQKSNIRIKAYGDRDEANSSLGICVFLSNKKLKKILLEIQNHLFDIGADLCFPENSKRHVTISSDKINFLENEIDQMNEKLEPLKSFILPGGSKLAAHLHVCRTVARRAERLSFELATMEEINPSSIKFLNRLSDWFFVAARLANNNGLDDVLWVPGANR